MELSSNSLIQAGFEWVFEKSDTIRASLENVSNNVSFVILPNVDIDLYLDKISKENHLTFFVNENSNLKLHIVNNKEENSFDILGEVKENGSIRIYFADLSNVNCKLNSNVILLGKNSTGKFRFSSVANANVLKKYNVGFDQLGEGTNSLFEGYGVALKNGEIDAKGISHIEKDSIKSIANQKVKVILFDNDSKAKASPTLRIDCDDIVANHACAIGSLNEDHIFYLKSRGLNEQDARKLITLGYLIPIEEYFDEKGKELIQSYIKENF